MSASRLEIKVGMFVIVVLGLAAVMTLKFSETGFGLKKTIPLQLHSLSAGTVIKNAPVQLSGVKIGVVDDIILKTDGSGVIIHAGIFPKYWSVLDKKCEFEIRVTGLMGDEFIAAIPFQERIDRSEELDNATDTKIESEKEELQKLTPDDREKKKKQLRNQAKKELLEQALEDRKLLKPGEERECKPPLDVLAIARDAQQLIRRVDNSMITLDTAINRLDQTVLSTETLTNLTATIAEFRMTSESIHDFADNLTTNIAPNVDLTVQKFHDAVSRVDTMLANNTNTLQVSLNNFAKFTGRLDASAGRLEALIATSSPMAIRVLANLTNITASLKISTEKLQATISTNQTSIDVIIKDVASVTANLKSFTRNADRIVAELEAGKGLAGGLLKDDKVRIEFFSLITNLNSAAGNLSILASNLNARGLLYKPPPTNNRAPPKSGRPR